jgi:hypothetical protein
MWSRLLDLFGKRSEVQEIEQPTEFISPEANEITTSGIEPSGPSSLIGYNYLGRKNEKDLPPRRNFINLNKLLRGEYKHEKPEETVGRKKSDIRGEDS